MRATKGYESSGDEYQPSDSSTTDDDEPAPKRRKKAVPDQNPSDSSESDDNDDIPLSVLQDKIRKTKEAAELNGEVLTQILDQPMWVEGQFEAGDVSFVGEVEAPPDNLKTPYVYFKDIMTDEVIELTQYQTSQYALEKSGKELKTTAKEIELFIGLYLRMGLVKAHSVRAYWAFETRHPPVADHMARSRFENVASSLHFVNNSEISEEQKDEDRLWKVRPFLQEIRKNLEKIIPEEKQSIDEVMVAFKGRFGLKQYIRSKPKRWGFKLWARTGTSGILHHFDVYQGSKGPQKKTDLGVGGNVVMAMTSNLETGKNFKIFADNLFSSLKLVKALRERGLLYVGTVKENRLKGCGLKAEKVMKKEGRGAMNSKVDVASNVVAVRWFDNKK